MHLLVINIIYSVLLVLATLVLSGSYALKVCSFCYLCYVKFGRVISIIQEISYSNLETDRCSPNSGPGCLKLVHFEQA